MARYRKKPIEVEAFLFGADNMPDWFMDKVTSKDVVIHHIPFDEARSRNYGQMWCDIKTLEGTVQAYEGKDYIIKGIKGEIYPCKVDIFEATYEIHTADVAPKSEVDDFEYKLMGVMHNVDKWLEGAELEQDEVNRAITMREKTLRLIEAATSEVERLQKLLDDKCDRCIARDKAQGAREILGYIIQALDEQIEKEDKIGRKLWDECDISGHQIHEYAEQKLDTLKTAFKLLLNKYTEEKNDGSL